MIRAVLDTNALASGFGRLYEPGSATGELIRRWFSDVFDLLVSDHILSELRYTLETNWFARRLVPDDINDYLAILRADARTVALTGIVSGVAAHRHDDPVLETAVAGRADYLVTGDAELLALGTYEGVVILTPREFLDVLDHTVDDLPPQE